MNKLNRHSDSTGVLRRSRTAWTSCFLVVVLLLVGGIALAQNVADLKIAPTSPNEKPTFWLLDENGSWRVPLPNWSLEDVMRTLDAQEEEESASSYSIQSVDAVGKVEDGVARLSIQCAVNVGTGAVRVPLGLKEGVYIPTSAQEETNGSRFGGFSFEGPGYASLDVDPETGEYVAIIRTAPRTPKKRVQSPKNAKKENRNANDNVSQPPAPQPTPAPEPTPAPQPTPAQEVSVLTGASVAQRYADENDDSDDDAERDESATRLRPNQYILTLELCFVVETIDTDEYRLVASFPPSVHSQLTLETPVADARISSVKGAVATPPTMLSESSSELKLRGLARGGERVELVWQRSKKEDLKSRLVFQVEDASIEVELEARETGYDVTLPVRAYGGDSDVFYVRLPDRASLTPDSVVATGYNGAVLSIKSVRETSEAALANEGDGIDPNVELSDASVVEVRLEQKTTFVVLKLKARVQILDSVDVSDPNVRQPIRRLAGFELLGAEKQCGKIGVMKSEDLDFNVAPIYGAANDSENVDAEERFEFYAQPFLLTAQLYKRQRIVNVKPEYHMTVGAATTELRVRFAYSIYGSKATKFPIRLNGWTFNYVHDDGVIDVNNVPGDAPNGEIALPLKSPVGGDYAFELSFSRANNLADDGLFTAEFPTPIADWVEPAAVVVVPENNVELKPDLKKCVALSLKSFRAFSLQLEQPRLVQPPSYYQTDQILSNSDEKQRVASFAAYVSKLERKTTITADSKATISEKGEFHIRQDFTYDVEHEALDSVSIRVPTKLLVQDDKRKASNVKYFVDGKLVPSHSLRLETIDGSDYLIRRVLLNDSPKIGAFVVTVQFDCAPVEFRTGATTRVELFLTEPDDEVLETNTLTFNVPSGVRLEYAKSDSSFWNFENGEITEDGAYWRAKFSSNGREPYSVFTGFQDSGDEDNQGVAIVERAWIQSWFANSARVDRAAYRLVCERGALNIRLPRGVRKDRVAVALDKTPLKNVADPERGVFIDDVNLRIPISKELQKREFTLELSYVVSNASPNVYGSNRRCYVQLPVFSESTTWLRRVYWQVVVPRSRHLVNAPKNWNSEYLVRRESGLGVYRRVASVSSNELSEWIGIDRREPVPKDVNIYLFSAFEQPSASGFYLIDRSILILLGSGVALAIGLGLVYFPSVRSPLILFLMSVVALAVAAIYPTLSLLFLQTTVLGLVLAFLAAVFSTAFGRGAKVATAVANIVGDERVDGKKRAQEPQKKQDANS